MSMNKEKTGNKKIVFVSDFDGTISKVDFFTYATEKIISNEDMAPWKEYKAGKIPHVEALHRIFSKIRLPKDEFDSFIDTIEVEDYFKDTVNLCSSKNIDFYVVSAGADYYINRVLKRECVDNCVTLITNPSAYSQECGLQLIPLDKKDVLYDYDLGVSKKLFINKLKKEGCIVIFAGDGMPDIEAATVADIVFAKDYLIELCNKRCVEYIEFSTYFDIYNFISNC